MINSSVEIKNPKLSFQSVEQGLENMVLQPYAIAPEQTAHQSNDPFHQGKREYNRQKLEQEGSRHAEIQVRDLEAQDALLNKSHPIYQSLENIAVNLSHAEEKVMHDIQRAKIPDYAFHITKRNNINAFTYRQGKIAFFESGLVISLDKYLKEVKGLQGIAEDHIAAILAHEIAHSDPEAELAYLNEEYCDVQGLLLTAEAGYNPYAALDVEEFLVLLESSAKPTEKKSDNDKMRENIYIPTHPDSQHRRLVIINNLKDKNKVFPNQAKPYTFIKQEAVADLSSQATAWQERCAKRVLPRSLEEISSNIQDSSNLTDLLDTLQGSYLYQKAAIAKELGDNTSFMNMITVRQAIIAEIKHHLEGELYFFKEKRDESFSSDVDSIAQHRFTKYDQVDLLVGGISQNLQSGTPAEISTVTNRIIHQVGKEISDLHPTVYAREKKVPYNRQMTEDQRSKAEDTEKRDIKMRSFLHTDRMKRIFGFLDKVEGQIDVARLLSGDFSQYPELQAELEALGIKDFRNYISQLRQNFDQLKPPTPIQSLISSREKDLDCELPDAFDFDQKPPSREEISSLLDKTKYYRAAHFAHRDINGWYSLESYGATDKPYAIADGIALPLQQKLRELAANMSPVSQQSDLLFRILSNTIIGETGEDVYRLPEQFAASVILEKGKIKDRFPSPLPSSIVDLTIAPSFGGSWLEGKINQADQRDKKRSAYTYVDTMAENLGWSFDRARFLHGELEAVQKKPRENWYHSADEVEFRLKPRTDKEALDLIAKRKSIIPTYIKGGSVREIKETGYESDISIIATAELSPKETLLNNLSS